MEEKQLRRAHARRDPEEGLEAKVTANAVPEDVPWAGTWLMKMIRLFERIQREPGSRGAIQCASYFAALEEMSGVYDLLFSVELVRGQSPRHREGSGDSDADGPQRQTERDQTTDYQLV